MTCAPRDFVLVKMVYTDKIILGRVYTDIISDLRLALVHDCVVVTLVYNDMISDLKLALQCDRLLSRGSNMINQ